MFIQEKKNIYRHILYIFLYNNFFAKNSLLFITENNLFLSFNPLLKNCWYVTLQKTSRIENYRIDSAKQDYHCSARINAPFSYIHVVMQRHIRWDGCRRADAFTFMLLWFSVACQKFVRPLSSPVGPQNFTR